MTARQVTEAMLRARRIADPDKAEVRRLIATVQTCLATAAKPSIESAREYPQDLDGTVARTNHR